MMDTCAQTNLLSGFCHALQALWYFSRVLTLGGYPYWSLHSHAQVSWPLDLQLLHVTCAGVSYVALHKSTPWYIGLAYQQYVFTWSSTDTDLSYRDKIVRLQFACSTFSHSQESGRGPTHRWLNLFLHCLVQWKECTTHNVMVCTQCMACRCSDLSWSLSKCT